MTPTLVHRVCGVDADREAILKQFYEDLRKANGKRRSDPEKFVKVVKVRGCAVFYRVPSRVLREIHQTP
jgi:hypothetical protein